MKNLPYDMNNVHKENLKGKVLNNKESKHILPETKWLTRLEDINIIMCPNICTIVYSHPIFQNKY